MEATDNKKVKKSVRIRLAKEAKKEQDSANSGKLGATGASLRNVPTAPRKMRLVADMIRGERVNVALNLLRFDHKHASNTLEKVLLSAIANWQQKNEEINIEDADLYIKEVFVDSGRILKRLRTAPQGRAHRIRKRSHHVSMVIDDRNRTAEVTPTETENS